MTNILPSMPYPVPITQIQGASFQQLYELILEGSRQFNLTRITDPQDFWEKHLWDSLRGVAPQGKLIPSLLEGASVIDVGTGAGFPGVPVAIASPNCTVTLVDATRKKITFVEKILATLPLANANTVVGRAEEIGQQSQHRQIYDIALIRAVGTASACAEYTLPLVKQGGLAVIYRGNWTQGETTALDYAAQQLGGVIESIEQFTTPLSQSTRHCLYLRKVDTTPAKFPRTAGVPGLKPL